MRLKKNHHCKLTTFFEQVLSCSFAETMGSGWEAGPIRASLTLMRISLRVLIKPDSQQKVGPLICKQNYSILILCSYYPLRISGKLVEHETRSWITRKEPFKLLISHGKSDEHDILAVQTDFHGPIRSIQGKVIIGCRHFHMGSFEG